MPAVVTLICTLLRADVGAVEARVAAAAAALPADCPHEVLLVGHGAPDDLAPVLRALQQRNPRWQVLAHTRPTSRRAALTAARAMLVTPWFLRVGIDPAGDRRRWLPAEGGEIGGRGLSAWVSRWAPAFRRG